MQKEKTLYTIKTDSKWKWVIYNVDILLGTVLKEDPLRNFLQRIIFASI